jgi:hypothetical protein
MENISPKFRVNFVNKIEDKLWDLFDKDKYANVEHYLLHWQETVQESNPLGMFEEYDFEIIYYQNSKIDLKKTLNKIPFDKLLKIAIDIGIDTPDIIPGMAFFRNEIKADNETASQVFEKAFKNIESDPADAIGFANSALESIIKEMLRDERIKVDTNKNDTLYKLATAILKEFKMYPESEMPIEIKNIGSSFLTISQAVESLRSDKTDMHGKTTVDAKIEDPMYAYFVVNAVTTVGLFLNSFYKKNYPKKIAEKKTEKRVFGSGEKLPF